MKILRGRWIGIADEVSLLSWPEVGCENEIVGWVLDLWMRFCPQSPRLDSRTIQDFHMGTLFTTENVKLAEERFALYLYLKNTTVEFHENYPFDVAFSFETLSHDEIRGVATALLAYIDGDDSIE